MNIKLISKLLLIGCIILALSSCKTDSSKTIQKESIEPFNAMDDWQNNKFSMFIHWGIYSIPAGVWNGEQISGYSEQIQGHAKISNEEYAKLASQFNPTKWDADSIALLAKKAGMKSIIITSKHHDGFCMFDSKYTEFDVVDATPYNKDVLKELSEACKLHKLNFGVYFSLIDWHFDGATPFVSVRNSDSIPALHHQYNLNQIEELLTNYGEISEIWFDMASPTYNQSKEMADLVKNIQPNCMISGRIWNDQGDFMVMGDNYQPEFKMGVPWQSPASMFNETWSYRSWQKRPNVDVKVKEKITDLLNIVSTGGNYLLNIGPKADGTVIPFEKHVLVGIGEWLETNGESVYNTEETPFHKQEWGVITTKTNKLYLHIYDLPVDNILIVKGLKLDILDVYPLTDNSVTLVSKNSEQGCEIILTNEIIKNKYATTIVVEYESELSYTPQNLIIANDNNEYILSSNNAEKYHSYSGHDYYSTKATVIKMKWYIASKLNDSSVVKIAFTSHNNDNFKLLINNQEYLISPLSLVNNNDSSIYKTEIESVNLDKGRINEIELSLRDTVNPHKGMAIEELQILLQ